MAVTHLANVADRIDRSYSPRGGREERELEIKVDESKSYSRETKSHRICSTGPTRFRFVHD
jgi:hypothetical protein